MEGKRIEGSIAIYFDTDKVITEEQFKAFKKKLEKMVGDWEMMVFDAAESCGFEADSPYPITLEELYLEEDED
jgi:hypothetical protein